MAERAIVPVSQLGTRMATQGRIRMGVKTGNSMKSIDTFRFTSPDEQAIRLLAARYGGDPRPWTDARATPRNQFEVITATTEVRIMLPQSSLSVWYEHWGSGGIQRRCDGEFATVTVGDEDQQVPCLCVAAGKLDCRITTRVNMILPDIPFGGQWMLETKGWTAAHELPGMAALVTQLQVHGVLEAKLLLTKQERMIRGRKKNFVVPRIVHSASIDEILSGAAAIGQLAPVVPLGQLAAGTPAVPAERELPGLGPAEAEWYEEDTEPLEVAHDSEPPPSADDEIVDAELVEPHADQVVPSRQDPPADPATRAFRKLVIESATVASMVRSQLAFDVDEDEFRHMVAGYVSHGRTSSSKELTAEEVSAGLDLLATMDPQAGRDMVLRFRQWVGRQS